MSSMTLLARRVRQAGLLPLLLAAGHAAAQTCETFDSEHCADAL